MGSAGSQYDPAMTLSHFLLSQQYATKSQIQTLDEGRRRTRRRTFRHRAHAAKRMEALEEDVGYLTLVLGALLAKANDKGVVSLDEIKATLGELDEIDGVKDGRLNVDVLRDLTD